MLSDEELNGLSSKIIDQVIERRKELGLSQRQLASKIGIPQSTIARIESKLVNPQMSTLTDITNFLGLSFSLTPKEK